MPDAPSLALSALVAPLIALLAPASSAERRPNLVALMAAGVGARPGHLGESAPVRGRRRPDRVSALGRHALATIIALLAIELAHTADAPEKGASSRAGAERRTGRRVYRMALRGGGLTLLLHERARLRRAGRARRGRARHLAVGGLASGRVAARAHLQRGECVGDRRPDPGPIDGPRFHRSPAGHGAEPGDIPRARARTLPRGAAPPRRVVGAPRRRSARARRRRSSPVRGRQADPGSPASGIAWADPPERSSLPSVLGALGATVTLVGGALAFVGSRRALAAPTIYIGSGLLLVLVLASSRSACSAPMPLPDCRSVCPRLPPSSTCPPRSFPGRGAGSSACSGAAVLLILFAATALALRDVINRALRTPDGKGSDAAGGRAKLVRPIMRTFLVVACAASFWSGDASRALLTGLGLAASAMLATLLADDEPGARLVGSLVRCDRIRRRLAARRAPAGMGGRRRRVPGAGGDPWRGPRSGLWNFVAWRR